MVAKNHKGTSWESGTSGGIHVPATRNPDRIRNGSFAWLYMCWFLSEEKLEPATGRMIKRSPKR